MSQDPSSTSSASLSTSSVASQSQFSGHHPSLPPPARPSTRGKVVAHPRSGSRSRLSPSHVRSPSRSASISYAHSFDHGAAADSLFANLPRDVRVEAWRREHRHASFGPVTVEVDTDQEEEEAIDRIHESSPLLRGGAEKEGHPPVRCWCCLMPVATVPDTPSTPYGLNYAGVNIFSLFFYGFFVAFLMEGFYVGIAFCFKRPKVLVYEGPLWAYTNHNFRNASIVWWTLWGLIWVVLLLLSGCRGRRPNTPPLISIALMLLLPAIPAGIGGMIWERDWRRVTPLGSNAYETHCGWMALVVLPCLWPACCFVLLLINSTCASFYKCLVEQEPAEKAFFGVEGSEDELDGTDCDSLSEEDNDIYSPQAYPF